jgi:hypothetical protein
MRRRLLASIACMTFLAGGCGDKTVPPIGPSPNPPPGINPSPPPFSFAETFSQIEVGEVVHRLVAVDSPECIEDPGWKCQYFRITIPSEGILKIDITLGLGQLDISLADSRGSKLWYPVVASVKAGATYEITAWYVTPGTEFEFRTSLQPA